MAVSDGTGSGREHETVTQSTVVDAWHGQDDANERTPERLESGDTLGRYVILDVLGSGGMGLVYKAYDPELDRQIAVKLVRVRGARKRRAQQRLLREAQALAQLSHPNVIAVYDVGTIGDDVFISMELVDGLDARKWLAEKPRSRSEILSLYIAAGRGLDAAHKAGMVHRDFKPENVVVGKNGRPRVIDFGLARGAETAEEDDVETDLDCDDTDRDTSTSTGSTASSGKNRLNTPLTQVGLVMGTPPYMAPETHRGREVDARSDQFSYCVSLYYALYGSRPFAGSDAEQLKAHILAGKYEPIPPDAKVPRWLRNVLTRGLATAPEDRFASMAELIRALEADPAIRRRRIAKTVGFAGVVATAAFWLASGDPEEAKCQDGPKALVGAWDDELRAATKDAFLATGRAHAASTFALLDERLTSYANSWVGMYKQNCEATNVRGEQSPHLLDLRTQCLRRHLDKMSAFTALLAKTDQASLIDRSVSVAAALPSVDACADVGTLTSAIPLPDDPAKRQAVADVRADIDRAEAMARAGDFKASLALSESIAKTTETIEYSPLRAEALYLLGGNQRRLRKAEAEETLYAAAQAAAISRSDEIAALTWLELLWIVGYTKAKPNEALDIRKLVEPAVTRSGNAKLRGDLLNNLGAILRRKGKYKEAKALLEEAIEVWDGTWGPGSLQVAKAHNNLGNVLNDMGNFREARAHHEKVLAIRVASLGAEHPFVATILNNLGNGYMEEEDYEKARDFYQRSLTIAESLDPNGADVVNALNNLGNANAELGQYARSKELQERALAIQKARPTIDKAGMGITVNNLADLYLSQKKYKEAKEHYEQSRDLWSESFGPDHVYVGHASYGIGNALVGLEQFAAAKPAFERAKVLWTAAHGADSDSVAMTLEGLGDCAIGLDQRAEAIELWTRATAMREAQGDEVALAAARFGLARAYWSSGKKDRALTMAKASADVLDSAPKRAAAEAKTVHTWIAKHQP